MILRIFFVLLLLMSLSDIYIYRTFINRSTCRAWLKGLYWLPSALLTLGLIFFLVGDAVHPTLIHDFGIYVIVYLTLVIPKCIFSLCSILGGGLYQIGQLFHLPKAGNYLKSLLITLGIIGSLASIFIILYGNIWGWRKFEVKNIEFAHHQIPQSFEGYRIVQISDLHLGTIDDYPHEVARAVDIINGLQPDMIAFTGDLVNLQASELEAFSQILSMLKAKDGVFSVLGNHDYGNYMRWPNKEAKIQNMETLKEMQRDMGWRLLLNENEIIYRGCDSIAIIGVENDGVPPYPAHGDLPKATQGTVGMFKVLLSHDPTHWRRKVLPDTDIQLMLAGHTHAMQLIVGGYSPAMHIFSEWAGMYKEADRGLYVNVGLGSSGIFPYRFGAWPEITIITLRRN